MVSNAQNKRIDEILSFVESKGKLVTDKKIKPVIVIDLRNERGQKTLGRISIKGNTDTNKYYYYLEILDEAFERLPIQKLKGVVLHELAHIPNTEKTIHNKLYKKQSSHGSDFKKSCKILGVSKEFACARTNIDKPKRRIIKMK